MGHKTCRPGICSCSRSGNPCVTKDTNLEYTCSCTWRTCSNQGKTKSKKEEEFEKIYRQKRKEKRRREAGRSADYETTPELTDDYRSAREDDSDEWDERRRKERRERQERRERRERQQLRERQERR